LEPKANYTLIGLIVLLLTATLISSLLWLSVGFERKKYDFYSVYIHESVSGLSEESSVKFNGVVVGSVKVVELDPVDPQQIKLTLKIEQGTPITTSTIATLVMQGITGNTFLGLSALTPTLEPLQKIPDEPYPVIPYKASFFSRLEKNITDVTNGVKRVFDKENAKLLKQSLTNLEAITETIAKNHKNIDESLHDLPIVMRDLKSGVRELSSTIKNISTASTQVTSTMKAGEDSIKKITNQTIPPATILLRRLDTIAANLEKVSRSMRQNPAVIIRGSTQPKPGPGE